MHRILGVLSLLVAGVVAAAAPTAPPAPPAPAPAVPPAPSTRVARTVAVTIDDLPGVGAHLTLARVVDVNRRLMQALRAAKAPAVVFVNEGKMHVEGELEARTGILREWLDSGFTLGNHTYSHKGLTATPLADWEQDVIAGEAALKSVLAAKGQSLVWFRHPFAQTGATEETRAKASEFLAGRGYRIAPITIEYSDWTFAALHEEAAYKPSHEEMQRLEDACLAYFEQMVGWYEALSRETFGREIPQVLLLHANALNATLLPDVLDRLKGRGYRFVTLEEALADPAYATPDGYIGRWGPSWLHRWRAGLNLPSKYRDDPDPPAWVLEADAARQKKAAAAAPAAPPPTASATSPGRP